MRFLKVLPFAFVAAAAQPLLPIEERDPGMLPPAARALLDTRMERHSQQMNDLLWSVIFLENQNAAEIAEAIAAEPRFARSGDPDSDLLNARIPELFLHYQAQLRDRAKTLGEKARDGDDGQIAQAFGELTQTCVSCHAAYLD